MFSNATDEDVRLSRQFRFDFFKHLSNLNVASILLVAGLLEKTFVKPDWMAEADYKNQLSELFFYYGFSVVCCLTMLFVLPLFVLLKQKSEWVFFINFVVTAIAIGTFLYGLLLTAGLSLIQFIPLDEILKNNQQ